MGAPTPGFPDETSAGDLHWLAGLLEGEGTFMKGPPSAPRDPILAVQMTDADVVARAAAMFGRKAWCWHPPQVRWQPTYGVRITGAKAVAWMTALRPLMGQRRRAQIDRALASYEPRPVAVLNSDRAAHALQLLSEGFSVRAVAERFGASIWCIYDLRSGRTYKHLPRL